MTLYIIRPGKPTDYGGATAKIIDLHDHRPKRHGCRACGSVTVRACSWPSCPANKGKAA